MRLLIALLLLLGACGPKPDYSDGTVEIWWNGHKPIPAVQATDIVLQQGLLICPDPKKLADKWCAQIHWMDAGFPECNGYKIPGGYAGCQLLHGYCEYYVGWHPDVADTALVDEEAHYVWEICFHSTGEDCWKVTDSGLNVCAEEDYNEFVGRTRELLRDAGL